MARRHAFRIQLARFVVVGVVNTAVSFVSYRLLLTASTPYVPAAALAFAAGAVNGYVFNRRWTFGAKDTVRTRLIYLAVQATGAVTASLLVFLLVDIVGFGKVTAYLAALPPVTLGTFVANRSWTFAHRADASDARTLPSAPKP